jgi:hypothetical protein
MAMVHEDCGQGVCCGNEEWRGLESALDIRVIPVDGWLKEGKKPSNIL